MQKESKKVARGRKSKKERLISKGLLPRKMRETKKISTGNEASQPIEVKHVATTCATLPVSHQCRTEPQASKKKKKKKWEEEGKTYIYI